MQLIKADSAPLKPEKPAAVLEPPDAPPAPSSVSITAPATTKLPGPVSSIAQAPQAAPAETGQSLKDLSLDGTGGKEEYGYIFTNKRSGLVVSFIQLSDLRRMTKLFGVFSLVAL